MTKRTCAIRALNDSFRRSMQTGSKNRVVMTRGVAALPPATIAAVMLKVQQFEAFTPDNDPHGEHDFGAFNHDGERFFFKIDYYAPDMLHGAEHPEDASQTVRVLTVMLASEY